MQETFIDLDELMVRCQDKRAKQLIQEAVTCYRAGAFRSCVVATWNAVVFDFLHKLRELDLLGNGEAANLLRSFEKISSEAKVKELWQFESNIPNWALTKFELISPVEQSDIQRLLEDRSRCAHPSMTSLEEPFEATAELARYHLRSAVMHLLQRPPVQGRSAKERIFQDIQSEYFPIDVELAVQSFKKGPLARARLVLIKDIVRGLTISLLTENRPDDERARQFSALNAIAKLYYQQTREILNDGLSDIIHNKVADENWDKVIIYLSSINAWEFLSDHCHLKAKIFIEKLDIFYTNFTSSPRLSERNVEILIKASYVGFLRELVICKFQIPLKDLLSVKEVCKDKIFNENILNPLLQNALPQANLPILVNMINDANDLLCTAIFPYLQKAIEAASIEALVNELITPFETSPLNTSLIHIIELGLKKKIISASLFEVFKTKEQYKFVDKPNPECIDLFEHTIEKLVKQASFNELLDQSDYWNDVPDDLMKPILKENVAIIVNKFIQSNSFNSASDNALLLIKVVEFLNPIQWQYILDAFCNNDQIYCSYACLNIFVILFKKSMNLNVSVAPYWISFRKNLNELKGVNTITLKHLIDSYQAVDF